MSGPADVPAVLAELAEVADLVPVVPAPDWTRALCPQTDPEAFFPEQGGSARAARRICARCEIRAECLAWAVATGQRHGIWGGTNERERRRLKLLAAGP